MERRFLSLAGCPVQAQARDAQDGDPMIVGYASVFYRAEDPGTEYVMNLGFCTVRERILPGAFDRALKESDIRALFNHNPDFLLGRNTAGTLRLSVDGKGLRYEIDPPQTQVGRDVLTSLQRGDLTGSSFSFKARAERWTDLYDGDGKDEVIREIMDAELFDVSPVTFPAYTSATSGVRSEDLARLQEEALACLKQRRAHYLKRARAIELDRL